MKYIHTHIIYMFVCICIQCVGVWCVYIFIYMLSKLSPLKSGSIIDTF